MSNSREAERKVNENIDKAASSAQDEVSRLRHELDDLRRRAGPKIDEAENFLTSPTALGFYQGMSNDERSRLTFAESSYMH